MSKGIYKITNIINNKCYIGKSSNIEERWEYHKKRYNDIKEYDKPLYRAFRKYNISNFLFEIIELMKNNYEELSDKREKYWIKYYNSYGSTGYNGTKGGDGGIIVTNPRKAYGKITNEEVIYLRKRYLECKYPASYIWEVEFKNKISKRGFQAIWLGENAKNIMPEIYTQENKNKQMKLSRAYEGVLRRRVTLEEKKKLKDRIAQGEKIKNLWYNEYKEIYKSITGFKNMLETISLDEEVELNGKELEKLE